MKKIIFIFLVCILSFQCSDNLLNVDPSDQYSEDTFWNTEDQIVSAVTGCYRSFRSTAYNAVVLADVLSPNAWSYDDPNGENSIAKGTHLTTNGFINSNWTQHYQCIGRVNRVLDNIDRATFTTDGLKDRSIGEAKFLRAYCYFVLSNYFGDVPLILSTPHAASQSDMPRTPKDQVRAQVLKDLDDAASLLPATYPTKANTGRATKGAALGMKARVLLYDQRWKEAAATAQQVIKSDNYALFSDYRKLFMPENANNVEVLFDVQFKNPEFLHGADHNIKTLNKPAPLKELVDAYLMTNGLPANADNPLYDPQNPYENRDPRLHQTIAIIGHKFNGETVTARSFLNTGFGQKKWTVYDDNEAKSIVTSGQSSTNLIIMRYAEVLLTYAEAKNEAEGPVDSVYWALNEVRGRQTVSMPVVQSGYTKEQLRDIIRMERRIEFVGEGLYGNDIRRWKTAETVMNTEIYNYEGKMIEKRSFDKDRDYLWPVPYNQYRDNPNLLPNNPKWIN
ncbi:MAG: RagB/SusD family nutrient uptake outer membrane protein [Bacteroidales bacterium]|nr:RagB/SusD family nutrient uptake outer membrane protein [Bacteroidales bacterium]